MKYLLDTHVYYWARSSRSQLTARAVDILSDPAADLILSLVTPWELAIKAGIGKLAVRALLVNFEQRELVTGYSFAAITVEQVVQSGLLPSHHRDPFDRLLIAQAFDLGVPIVSKDKTFDLYGVQRIWD